MTSLVTDTVFKSWRVANPTAKFDTLGSAEKTDGTKVNCWYDRTNDKVYFDPTYGSASSQNPTI